MSTHPASQPTHRTCAVCTDLVASHAGAMEALGKGGALVFVCSSCADEPIVSRDGPRLGYQGGGGSLSVKKVKAAMIKVTGGLPHTWDLEPACSVQPVSPGHVIERVVRVGRRGVQRDQHEARATLRNRTWYAALVYLGATEKYFLFERPDTRRKPKVGYVHKPDPLEPIRKYQVK